MAATAKYIQLSDINQPLKMQGPEISTPCSPQCHEEETMASHDDHLQRPSIKGAYRPIRNGTIRGSIFAMLTSSLGTGSLSLPYRASKLGIIPFVLVVLVCALLAYLGMYFMERIIVRFKVASYSQMVRKSFGERTVKLCQLLLIGYPLSISVSLQVIFSKFIVQLLADVFGLHFFQNRALQIYSSSGHVARIIVAMALVALNTNNFFKSDLRQMLHSLGKFSVSGVIFCLVCIVLTALTGFTRQVEGEAVVYRSIISMDAAAVHYFKPLSVLVLLQSTSGIFFAFLNPQFVFPLISHLKKPTRKRVDRIFKYTHYQLVLIYLVFGIIGYLLLSQHADLLPISPLVVTSIPTAPLLLGKFVLSFALFFALPLQMFTARQFIYEALDLQRNEGTLLRLNVILVGSTCAISMAFQKVTTYFGFIGGTMGVLMAVVIPTICMHQIIACSLQDKSLLLLALLLSAFLFVGAIESLANP